MPKGAQRKLMGPHGAAFGDNADAEDPRPVGEIGSRSSSSTSSQTTAGDGGAKCGPNWSNSGWSADPGLFKLSRSGLQAAPGP